MAPEQAKGKAVDKRADIWAFGCVLFEMLTGRAVFAGETVTETLAAVMRDAPPLDALPGRHASARSNGCSRDACSAIPGSACATSAMRESNWTPMNRPHQPAWSRRDAGRGRSPSRRRSACSPRSLLEPLRGA